MENLSYYIERIPMDRWDFETDKSRKYQMIDLWRETERGKFLSKHQVSEVSHVHDMAGDRIILLIKFALSPRDVTFFNLKFGK